MNKYKIITVGFYIKLDNILNISMNSNDSLLDGDIIIINPGNIEWINEENKYKYGGNNLININNNNIKNINNNNIIIKHKNSFTHRLIALIKKILRIKKLTIKDKVNE